MTIILSLVVLLIAIATYLMVEKIKRLELVIKEWRPSFTSDHDNRVLKDYVRKLECRIESLEKDETYSVLVGDVPISGVRVELDGSVRYETTAMYGTYQYQKLTLSEATHIAKQIQGKVVKFQDKQHVIANFEEVE